MGHDVCRALIEPLELRRLCVIIDLDLFPDPVPPPPIRPETVMPGHAINVYGTTAASSKAALEFRLFPLNPLTYRAIEIDSPPAVPLGTLVGGDLTSGSSYVSVHGTVTVPSDAPGGLYVLQVREAAIRGSYAAFGSPNEVFHVLEKDGTLVLDLTGGSDSMRVSVFGKNRLASRYLLYESLDGGPTRTWVGTSLREVTGVIVRGLGGNDYIVVEGVPHSLRIDGGEGNDTLIGGEGDETLGGGSQKDVLYGGAGHDRLNGNGGNDKLFGEGGRDRLFGYAGNDFLDGGSSNDRLDGGDGADVLRGNSGNDRLFARDDSIDQLFGDKGIDAAQADPTDVLTTIE